MSATVAPALDVRGVVKGFGAVRAVDGVSLAVRAGEVLGVVGPNGAGKSTLVNIISGLVKADAGEIAYRGVPIHRLSPDEVARLGVARTFQIVKPLRDLSVIENVMVGALFGRRQCRSTREARRIAEEALAQVQLGHRAEAECRKISTGETKKLDLARALAMDPDVLLLDEPLAGVGARESQTLIELIVGLAKSGKAILLVEHVMRVVWTISDRVAVLHHGAKIAEGPPKEVAADEQVMAAYLGARYIREVLQRPADDAEPGADSADGGQP